MLLGYNVLLVDQAGNGNSAGFRTTVGYREADDVVAVVRYLRTQRPTDSLILYGVSMGAVAILRTEAEPGVHPTANILECPYGNMCQTAYNRFASMHVLGFPMADLLVFWGGVQNGFWAFGLNAEHYATQIHTPTLLLWGTADPRVTCAETDTIFAPPRRPESPARLPQRGPRVILEALPSGLGAADAGVSEPLILIISLAQSTNPYGRKPFLGHS